MRELLNLTHVWMINTLGKEKTEELLNPSEPGERPRFDQAKQREAFAMLDAALAMDEV